MKKQLLIVVALLVATCVNAQGWQKGNTLKPAQTKTTNRATITPGENQAWWGYASSDGELVGLGVNAADTYHCAIFIPGNHEVAAGKTIKAVRFFLNAPNATDVKVWLSTTLPASAGAASEGAQDVKLASGINDVALSTPYTIGTEGIYVGYSFTITRVASDDDAYPVATTTDDDAPNTMFIKTDTKVPSWSDMNGEGFGRLFLQVLLEGEFDDNMLTPMDFGPVYGQTSSTVGATVKLDNQGYSPVTSFSYTISTDGDTSPEYTATLDTPIAGFSRGWANIVLPTGAVQDIIEQTLTVTKVNGNANQAADKEASFTLVTLSEIISRNVLVEQFTGTTCGWCPRGHVGMAKLREAFGDRFVGVALHQYSSQSSDAMYIANSKYAPISFNGAPSARIDRGAVVDPYNGTGYGIVADVQAELDIPALADVQVSGTFSEDLTKVDAKANVRTLFNGNYKLEFVLTADGLKGTGTGWNQANKYAQYNASQLPDDLAQFANGGAQGTSVIQGMTFNDVAIASSYVSSTNQVPAQTLTKGVATEVSYTLNMPTYEKLKNAIQQDNVYVIAILTDSDGSVVNAAKAKVSTDATGIASVKGDTHATAVARYTLDGRQIAAPQRGLNIVKMSDGSIRKIIVK